MYDVSFPGLGIESIKISDTAFTVFGRDIKWYGLIIMVGMICAVLYAWTRAKHEKISSDDLTDYALFTIIFGIIGARAYYVAFHFDSFLYTSSDSFFENLWETVKASVAIWNGGLAIYGGIIAGILVILIVSLKKKIKTMKFLDCAAPAVMIGQIFGRWGNFMNQEAFGTNTTLPWGMYSNGTRDYLARHQGELAGMGITVDPSLPVHPTFLYESLWNLIGFAVIHFVYKKKKYDGQVFLLYVAWYGFGRMVIEEFRTDSLMLGPFRISQLVALLTFLTASAILLVNAFRKKAVTAEKTEGAPLEDNAEEPCTECESSSSANAEVEMLDSADVENNVTDAPLNDNSNEETEQSNG